MSVVEAMSPEELDGVEPMHVAMSAWATVHGLATLWLDGALSQFTDQDQGKPIELSGISSVDFAKRRIDQITHDAREDESEGAGECDGHSGCDDPASVRACKDKQPTYLGPLFPAQPRPFTVNGGGRTPHGSHRADVTASSGVFDARTQATCAEHPR